MKKPGNEAVRDLLDGLQSADAEAYEVVTAIRDLIYEVHPATTEKMINGCKHTEIFNKARLGFLGIATPYLLPFRAFLFSFIELVTFIKILLIR